MTIWHGIILLLLSIILIPIGLALQAIKFIALTIMNMFNYTKSKN